MTIIAGFRCVDGVVICGDTQETSDVHKRNVTKVTVFPEGMDASAVVSHSNLMAAFCGAGNGDFIDLLIRKAWESTAHSTDLDQACDFIELTIKDIYKEYGAIYQQGQCPHVSLVYGVKMNGQSRLFRAVGPLVNPIQDCTSNGAGYFMADFLSARMYNRRLTVYQCAILAAYILFQAKEHVDGCGGKSHIAVLRDTAGSGRIDNDRIEAITQLLIQADAQISEVLIRAADLTATPDHLKRSFDLLQTLCGHYRDTASKEIKESDIWANFVDEAVTVDTTRDELGFVRLSDLQKSEGQL